MAAKERDIAGYTGAVLIGRGGFGSVYRAADATHGREVAIKVLPGELGEAERRRFDRERQTMGRLGAHPFVIPVYESGYTETGEGYIVMELASGGSLRDRLRTATIPWNEAAKIMAAIADATQAAHDSGVLHRDIKPDNILIDQFGNPKLSDFGIAAVASNATATTSTTATIAHAAPELLLGERGAEPIDIYAIGSTMHTLITGRPPFLQPGDEGVAPMINRALNEPPPDLRRRGVPDGLAKVIEQAMAKSPSDRQASAAELAEDLRAGHPSSQTISPGSPTPPSQPATGNAEQVGDTQIAPGGPAGLPPALHTGPSPESRTGSWAGKVGLLAFVGITVLAGLGLLLLVLRGDDPPTDDRTQSAITATGVIAPGDDTSSTLAPEAPAGSPTVMLDCPDEIVFNSQTFCSIFTTDAVSGEWSLPTFLPTPETIEVVPGEYEIFVEPTNPAAIGQTFTITATVTAGDGTTAAASHTFTVVDDHVLINCPDEIELNTSIECEIVSKDVVAGTWNIRGFGSAELQVVPGTNPIFIEPKDPASVGRSFAITATAQGADGTSYEATSNFVVIAGSG